ncbi:MAG: M2 family metallopeptidase [Planctomycetota bacterium]
MRATVLVIILLAVVPACHYLPGVTMSDDPEARAFLDRYSEELLDVYYDHEKAAWAASTDVSDEHTQVAILASKALSRFTGAAETIREARRLLERRDSFTDLQARQLEKILLWAAENPLTIPDVVSARIEAEGAQSQALDGFKFRMAGADGTLKEVTPNDIDQVLRTSCDLDERRRAFEAAKSVGPALREGLVRLRGLRNQVAREMGHAGFFSLQVADYGMSTPEMMELMDGVLEEIRPLYEQLHCFAKRQLARRYGQPVPRRIPAHWLGNRWGQEWPGLVEGIGLDPLVAKMAPEDLIRQAEEFYVSMGFQRLPPGFHEKSDLYELPAGSRRMKNTHASAWHLDLNQDVRSLMSVRSDFNWFLTTHHELGHIYYYLAYSRPEVPVTLREGANRAFHEGIGELISLAASQQPYMKDLGLLTDEIEIDEIQWLLNDALTSVVFLPWSAGVMSHFEHDLYEEELPAHRFNERWWDLKARYQGIEPPEPRGEEYCDPATKTHINDDPAQYYDYALATVLKFQFHDYICREILHVDPHQANYRGSREVGAFLNGILELGATRDWREVLEEATGEPMSGRAMLEYFAPLLEWLREQNQGFDCSFD